jgi:DNA primase catalytic subunit
LKGSHSNRPLDEKIKESKKSVQALQNQLEYLQTSTLVATNDTVSRMDPRLANVEETMNGAQRLAWETRNRTSAMQSSIGDVDRNIGLMQQDVSKQLEETIRVNRQLESSVEATKNIMAVLKGVLHFAECETSIARMPGDPC